MLSRSPTRTCARFASRRRIPFICQPGCAIISRPTGQRGICRRTRTTRHLASTSASTSASTATTCCRCSRATGSSAVPTSRQTAPRASCAFGASRPSRVCREPRCEAREGRAPARAHPWPRPGGTHRVKTREVSVEAARRMAVHAQLLAGNATDLLETVRTLGFLQMDPISLSPRRSTSCRGAGSAPTTHGARPAALGDAAARRVERVHLARRGPAAPPGADGRTGPWVRRHASSTSAATRRSGGTCSASSSVAGRCSRARSRITARPAARRTAGGASARWA